MLSRHTHWEAFAALVLTGQYIEAGDTGRHHVSPGDVLFHRGHERHLSRVGPRGADVLVLPLPRSWYGAPRGRARDADAVARLAARDFHQAAELLCATTDDLTPAQEDWPDALAAAIIDDPGLPLAWWAVSVGLHPGSLGRGFRQQFGLTPAAFRLAARTHRAIRAIETTDAPLAAVALEAGFSDQAHMTRAVTRMTGRCPMAL